MLFNNTTIEIWQPNIDKNNKDPYTKEPKTTYTLKETTLASFQNETTSDEQREYGEIPTNKYKIYIPLKQIHHQSIIRIQDSNEEYVINGKPQQYNHLIPHTKLTLELKRTKDLPPSI